MICAGLSELSVFYNQNGKKSFPGYSPHKEHTCKTLAYDVNAQHKI